MNYCASNFIKPCQSTFGWTVRISVIWQKYGSLPKKLRNISNLQQDLKTKKILTVWPTKEICQYLIIILSIFSHNFFTNIYNGHSYQHFCCLGAIFCYGRDVPSRKFGNCSFQYFTLKYSVLVAIHKIDINI